MFISALIKSLISYKRFISVYKRFISDFIRHLTGPVPCGPQGPLWPAVARLWPLVARCGPLVAPCGPFVFYGRTFEKFSRGPLCGPPGYRATRNFSKVRFFGFFFHFSADGLRGEEKKELYFLFSF